MLPRHAAVILSSFVRADIADPRILRALANILQVRDDCLLYTHTHAHTDTHPCILRVLAHILQVRDDCLLHTHTHTHMYIYIYIYTCMYVCVCIYI